jgi:type III restriction enzyme
MAVADSGPERRFIGLLCDRDNARQLAGWLKNVAQGFYPIEYAWKKGQHPKRGEFSPDFFVKKDSTIYVVEVKGDEEIAEPSAENQKKYEYAVKHFETLNRWLKRQRIPVKYQFNFLTPKDFNKFFQKLRAGDLDGFRSELDVTLAE